MSRKKASLLILSLASLTLYVWVFVRPLNIFHLVSLGFPPDLGKLTGYSLLACAQYVGAVTALFGLYLAGLYFAHDLEGDWAIAIVAGGGIISALALCHTYPFSASDLFLYIARGRVLGIYGQNSMAVAPNLLPGTSTYVPFPSEWTGFPSPYGPLWEWIAALLARLGDGSLLRSLLVFKYGNLVMYVACLLMIYVILRRHDGKRALQGLLAFAWNPLVLLEAHAQGHNDLYMVMPMLLALWAWDRKRYSLTIVLLALAGLVKYVPFLLIPAVLALLWNRLPHSTRNRTVLRGILLSLLLIALVLVPLWPGKDWGVFKQMRLGHHSITAWLILTLQLVLKKGAFTVGTWIMRLAFTAIYIWQVVRSFRENTSLAQTFHRILYTWLLLGALAFGYWYITWLVALASVLPLEDTKLRTIAFSWSGLISVAWYTFGGGLDQILTIQGVYSIATLLVFALPFLGNYRYRPRERANLFLAR